MGQETNKKSSGGSIRIGADPHDIGNIEAFKRILGRLRNQTGLRGYLSVNIPDHHINTDLQDGVLIAHADLETNTEVIKLLIGYYERVVSDLQVIIDNG